LFTGARDERPIIALCTPRGSGAIALLRLSGAGVFECAKSMVRLLSGKQLSSCTSHTIHHGFVIDPSCGDVIDEVLFLLMRAPKTFTGDDTLEITCHNNPFVIDRIIEAARTCGVFIAGPGEFSKRAVLNGKLDMMQAEALNDVIHSQSQQALRVSMNQLQGSLSSCVHAIEQDLVALLGIVEASFEFLDEEQRDLDFDALILKRLNAVHTKIKTILDEFPRQQLLKEGVRVALLGLVNAGKSTLFNALLKKDRAIVTTIEGTTRDSIEAGIYRNGMAWTLVDTAGLRKTENIIEQHGIARSWQEGERADIVVIVFDASIKLGGQLLTWYEKLIKRYHEKCVIVANKIDKGTLDNLCDFGARHKKNAHTRMGVADLEKHIEEKISTLFSSLSSPFLLTKRQHTLLCEVEMCLQKVLQQKANGMAHELMAHHLKDALERLSELTGKNIQEKMFEEVFKTFCVGK